MWGTHSLRSLMGQTTVARRDMKEELYTLFMSMIWRLILIAVMLMMTLLPLSSEDKIVLSVIFFVSAFRSNHYANKE